MSNEKKLEALKKALELGANIQINFHTDPFEPKETDKEEMEGKIKAVTDILGFNYEHIDNKEEDSSLHWFKSHSRDFNVIAFYHEEKEEVEDAG